MVLMIDHAKTVEFRHRLAVERRRLVLDGAAASTLPPSKFLSYLADLDGVLAAVEAVLDEERSEVGSARAPSASTALN